MVETAFILNLLILSITTFYQINAATSIKPITYASVGTTLALSTAIVLYHIVTKVLGTNRGQKLNVGKVLLKLRKSKQIIQSGLGTELTGSSEPKDKVTYSVIQLEEPLI